MMSTFFLFNYAKLTHTRLQVYFFPVNVECYREIIFHTEKVIIIIAIAVQKDTIVLSRLYLSMYLNETKINA